jgi:RHS repeat-associated protein
LRPRQTGEKAISIVATDSNQPPKRTEAVRTVQLPAANPVRYTYDANGNLLSDGVWTYTWTTECRLAALEPAVSAVSPEARRRLEFVYDGEGRRRWRKAYSWDAQAEAWVLASQTTFVYDQWNLIAEFSPQLSSLIPQRTYAWGLDLSQTLHGAGGVGGLLSITRPSSLDPSLFVAYDGNGNVVALVDSSTGALAAEYDYSPFGETLRATGPAADGNPFRFSTKCLDQLQTSDLTPQPSLYYYGLRYFNPGLGRWMSRDPIGEPGGANLFGTLGNSPVMRYDVIGGWWGGWIPYLGPIVSLIPDPPGADVGDYRYTMPPAECCDDWDVAKCQLALDAQMYRYIVRANCPAAIGLAMDAICIAASTWTFPWGLLLGLACTGDAALKGIAMIVNTQEITSGATAAKAAICKCPN